MSSPRDAHEHHALHARDGRGECADAWPSQTLSATSGGVAEDAICGPQATQAHMVVVTHVGQLDQL